MKPRLRLIRCLWYCALRHGKAIGCGYTPAHAYEEWLRLGGKA